MSESLPSCLYCIEFPDEVPQDDLAHVAEIWKRDFEEEHGKLIILTGGARLFCTTEGRVRAAASIEELIEILHEENP